MKQTANYDYPYPECNPPFVKDVADLPAQLKAFAELVDDDLTAINTAASGSALNPPAALLTLTAPEVIGAGALGKFNNLTTVVTNIGSLADGPNAQMRAPTAGLYYITGSCASTSAPNGVHRLGFRQNGNLFRAENIFPNAAAGNAIANNTVSLAICQAGDTIDLVEYQPGPGTVTYQSASLGMFRLIEL